MDQIPVGYRMSGPVAIFSSGPVNMINSTALAIDWDDVNIVPSPPKETYEYNIYSDSEYN